MAFTIQPTRSFRRKGKGNKKGASGGKGAALVAGGGKSLTAIIEPWMPIFPAKAAKMLRYSTSFSLTCTAGVVASYVFRANDLFDPDFTSTGHQPMGFDQMMLSYNHFCVVKARIICTFECTSGTNTVVGCIRQDATSTALTVIDRIIEFGGLIQCTAGPSVAGDANQVVELSLDVAKLNGVSNTTILADDSLKGDVSTSPTELTYFHVQAWNANGVNTGCNVNVVLEQLAVFTEPRDLVESFREQNETKTKPRTCPHSASACCTCFMVDWQRPKPLRKKPPHQT